MEYKLEKAIFNARQAAKDTGKVYVVSVTEKAYQKYIVASILDHYSIDKDRRPQILKIVFPETTINVQEHD